MNRVDRLSAILIMLQSKKIVKSEEIAERFGISKRTVYRDMRALHEAGVPLYAEAGIGYSLAEGYHLPPVMFTPEEAGSLIIASKLIENFSDNSIKYNFNLAADKIKSVLPENQKDFVDHVDKSTHIFYSPEKPLDGFSNNYLTAIQKAISQNKCVKIDYFSKYKEELTNRIVEPLGLCFYGFSWHLISYCKLRNNYRDFRMDRVKSLVIIDDCIKNKGNFTIEKYFEQSWEQEAIYACKIIFSKEAALSIAQSKYYFGFYREKIHNEEVEMDFIVNDYEYIANWILNLGNKVVKVNTVELENKIKELVANLNSLYA